jgi:5-methylcytosine-specific restriction endonuclease McrA/DNA-directed RNA polymerase subunit RPC12/RpoP
MVNKAMKSELICRNCGASWKYIGKKPYTTCPYCGVKKKTTGHLKDEQCPFPYERLRTMVISPEKRRENERKRMAFRRKRIFFIIGQKIPPVCARCGCDDSRLLEINHKNGGGGKETLNGKSSKKFYDDIAKGRRKTDDLELLCKPCNSVHALELKYGQLSFEVKWNKV